MSCNADPIDVFECDVCKCHFEPGVAGVAANGTPRCPDCGFAASHAIDPEDAGDFVVMRWNGFG